MLPGRLRNRGVVGVFIDVSGSISSVELEAFLAELRGILATTNCLVRFMTWDVSVGEDLVLEDEEDLSVTLMDRDRLIQGGGGTDPQCVLDRLLEPEGDHPLPSFAVLLTDGFVPWPKASEWPIDLLVVTTGPLPLASLGYESLALECP
jgi:predicted metal-dependent peptidase